MRGIAACLVATLLWASAFPAITFSLREFTPYHLALLRYIFVTIAALIAIAVMRVKPPALKDLPRFFLLGLFGVAFYHITLYLGQQTIKAGTASLLVACTPILTAIFAWKLLDEKFGARGWAGTGLAFVGAVLISFGQGERFGFSPGALWILLTVLTTACYNVTQKGLLRRYSAREATLWPLVLGTLPLFAFTPGLMAEVRAATPITLWTVFYLGIGPGAIAYLTWAVGLKRAPASVVSSFLYLMPATAMTISWFWLSEVPTPLTLIGGALCLMGVALVNLRKRAKPTPAVPPAAPAG